ncbi:glycerol kinase GlpK [Micrococcus endophyticus]|uniref:glycerol kinase GlpK n=1 Tax=Micrococcus endophyticus TaxID=455343 RepID=UPI0034CF9C21
MSAAQAVVAVDQGTTSTRVAVLGADGAVLASAQREHAQHFPAPGWVEHDPVEIWEAVRELTSLALTRARVDARRVAAVGITNQRETVVAWDVRTGRPVHRAIVWQDTRTADAMARLAADGREEAVRERTGLPLTAYFSASKIRWLLDEVPEARELSRAGRLRVGTMDAWLVWNLTGGMHGGVHATDVTNASRTLLMDLATGDWSAEMLELFGLEADRWEAMAPRIRPSIGRFGEVAGDVALAGVPVSGVLGDQQAAAFGQALYRPGDTKNTYGTGCFLLQHTGTVRPTSHHGLVSTVAFQREGGPLHYALEGSVAVAGSLVQWLRDGLGIISSSAEVEEAAASVPDNGGVVIVPAFSGLYAPHWRPDARGVIAGLTGYAGRGHLARAAVEATAYQSRDLLEALTADTGRRIEALRVDGGMTVNESLLQFQADILGVPVVRPRVTETTVQGAAWAAGLAAGVWPDLGALAGLWHEDRRWEPAMEPAERERLLARWGRAVEASLGWA